MSDFNAMSEAEWERYGNELLKANSNCGVVDIMRHVARVARQDGYNQGVLDAKENIRSLICAWTK